MTDRFSEAIEYGFLNRSLDYSGEHSPKLITNENGDVMQVLRSQISNCINFTFSVAFVSPGAIHSIKQELIDFSESENTKKGTIITSTMNMFNSPKALRELHKLKIDLGDKIDVKIYKGGDSSALVSGVKFHPKGYIFEYQDYTNLIVGSSNFTNAALHSNYEWNVKFSSKNDGQIVYEVANAIESQLTNESTIDLTPDYIDKYEKLYNARSSSEIREIGERIKQEQGYFPNEMQIEALHKLLESRNNNKNKALIISATGTGKTILAAFDVRRFVEEHQKAKVLFIAHRELLLTQAKDKFERIIGDKIASYGFYNGHNDSKCDCLFTTNIMLSKNLQNFKFDEFDYIIIDESHRSASNTYQNIFEYFKPKFLLGMTATPERADDAEIVFSLFDHNVPYEIRLQKALELDILSPFHYYAVSDVEQIEDLKKINQLEVHTGDERVDYLIEKINLYRQADTILKGLIFCSRIDEAKILSNKFNAKGFKTVSLSGSDNENQRETAIEDLENGKLDLIFTVDIFNEGVDIPSVNFVGLCRNTQSSVVFIQQLGRGLRKCKGKDDVVIVDFIGNYDNNYMIPLALFGKSGVTNDKLRNRVFDPAGQDINIGYSSISFDKIAKQKIFDSISPAKLKGKKNIADDCKLLNAMLGRLPFLFDFYNEETLDPRIIMSRNDFNSIVDVWNYAFDKSENFSKIELNESQKYVINFLSQELLNGIRLQELKMLKQLLVNETINFNDFEFEIDGAINVLKGNFFDKKYDALNIIDVDELNNKVSLSRQFQSDLNNELFKKLIEDAIMTGLKINETEYKNAENLVIGKQYSYVDVWRLLNFTKTEVWLNVGGYKTINKVTPIFVKYQKDDRVSSNVRYDDHFESPSKFVSISKSGRSRQSNEVKNYIDGTRHLFVRKSDDDGKFFYYLGTTQINTYTDSEANGENGQVAKTVTFDMTLDTPVEEHLYRYITEG